jgi:preprotein translocase subunit SecF
VKTNIQFIKNRKWAYLFSAILFITFTTTAVMRGGVNWGIDFAGGVKATVEFDNAAKISDIRSTLDASGLPNSVQQVSSTTGKNQFLISTKLQKGDKTGDSTFTSLKGAIITKFPSAVVLGNEVVGPSIGDYLKRSAAKMVFLCILMMTIYLAFRFEFKFSLGAMIALVHDVVLSIALAAALRVEFDIPVLAAILTIFGYSVNDTIVIFDRIRENMGKGGDRSFSELMNTSINETLSRTVITVFCTLLSVVAIFFLGGEVLHGFATVLIFGFVIGCYSSIFIASPVVLAWSKYIKKEKHD